MAAQPPKKLLVQTLIILLCAAGCSVSRLYPPPTDLTALANKHDCLWPRLLCQQTLQFMSKMLKQCNLLPKHQWFGVVIISGKLNYQAPKTLSQPINIHFNVDRGQSEVMDTQDMLIWLLGVIRVGRLSYFLLLFFLFFNILNVCMKLKKYFLNTLIQVFCLLSNVFSCYLSFFI